MECLMRWCVVLCCAQRSRGCCGCMREPPCKRDLLIVGGCVMAYDLDFEKPLAEIEQKILKLRRKAEKLKPDEREQIEAWEAELHQKTGEIYRNLNSWQCVQVARHKDRPYTLDYIKLICDDFFELRGDRRFSDDRAIQGGLAVIDGRTVMLMGN